MKMNCSKKMTIALAILIVAGAQFAFQGEAKALTASTSLTVVNVTKWVSPDCTGYKVRGEVLTSVNFTRNAIYWSWKSPWRPYPNTVSGRIWAIWCDRDGGKSCTAQAWDWIGNSSTYKNLHKGMPNSWMGTMLSTACGAPGVTCNYQTSKERTDIIFAPYP